MSQQTPSLPTLNCTVENAHPSVSYYSRPQVTSYNTYYHSTPHLPPYSAYDFQVGTLRDVSLFSGKVKPSRSAGLWRLVFPSFTPFNSPVPAESNKSFPLGTGQCFPESCLAREGNRSCLPRHALVEATLNTGIASAPCSA